MKSTRTGIRRLLVASQLTAAIATAAVLVAGQPAEGSGLTPDTPRAAVPGSYVVVLTPEAPIGDRTLIDRLARRHNATITHRFDTALHGFAARMSRADATRLAVDPAVAHIEQDQVVGTQGVEPTPPSWGLDRVDQRNLPLNRSYAFATTASTVHAYVIDTGMRTTHSDFGGRATWDFNSIDAVNTDCNGHGTHVAGIIGGARFGVAKAVRLHAVKVLNCSGSGTVASVIAGIDWVTANHQSPAVANMSLGGGASAALDAAVRNSIASGVTHTIAAGNSNADACGSSPARVREAVTVGASTIGDGRAWFSNVGACLDVFAPGAEITSAWNTSDAGVATLSGTSMAAPHAAGVAALYLRSHARATPAEVRDHLFINASVGRLTGVGIGSPNRLVFAPDAPVRTGADTLHVGQSLTIGQLLRSAEGDHKLVMQGDGNLVRYQAGFPLWSTGTHHHAGSWATLSVDGDFVVRAPSGTPLWATNTAGSGADRLVLRSSGQIVLLRPDGHVVWPR